MPVAHGNLSLKNSSKQEQRFTAAKTEPQKSVQMGQSREKKAIAVATAPVLFPHDLCPLSRRKGGPKTVVTETEQHWGVRLPESPSQQKH